MNYKTENVTRFLAGNTYRSQNARSVIPGIRNRYYSKYLNKGGRIMHKTNVIARIQEKKSDARFYKLLIRNNIVTSEERILLWHWFWKFGSKVDRRGKVRMRLIRDIPDEDIVKYLDSKCESSHLMEKIRFRIDPVISKSKKNGYSSKHTATLINPVIVG